MRIVIATDHYPPFIGGAHRQAHLLAHGMSERGHTITVATPWHGGLPRVARDGAVTIHRLRQLRTAIPALVRDRRQRHQPPFSDPVTVRDLRRVIAAAEPDVVHAYGWLAFSVATALGRRRIPLLLSARDYGYFCATRTLLRRNAPCDGPGPLKCLACTRDYYGTAKGWTAAAGVALSGSRLARRVDALHSVSTYVHEITWRRLFGDAASGCNGARGHVVIPSFQLDDDAAGDGATATDPHVAACLARLPAEPFILYVGAFRKVKGLETLFAAYRRLAAPPPLVLMGTFEHDSPSPSDFPPDAIVVTDVPHAAVMAAWDRALFGVLPSLWPEPFGATVAEAMRRGRAVIGTRPGGHVDMIDEESGILVQQGDVEGLAGAMGELIRDPARRAAYGRAAAVRAQAFSASVVLPRFEQAYRDVIAAALAAPE
jgi:glycosyltransferase involved in cell wall biosynthesis